MAGTMSEDNPHVEITADVSAYQQAMAAAEAPFVEVLVEATNQVTRVPRDWIDHPVLGVGIEKTTRQRILDGDVEAADVDDVPTERDTHKVIDAYAERAGIDLGNAGTKAEKVAVITAALAAAPIGSVDGPLEDAAAAGVDVAADPPHLVDQPDVQVEGPGGYPATPATTAEPTDDDPSPDETPDAGDKE